MIKTHQLVSLLINKSSADYDATYYGPLPSLSFRPVSPSAIFSSVLTQLLGKSDQSKLYQLAVLMETVVNTCLGDVVGSQLSSKLWRSLLIDLNLFTTLPTTGAGISVLSRTGSVWSATEYSLQTIRFTRLSAEAVNVSINDESPIFLESDSSGSFNLSLIPDTFNVLFKLLANSVTLQWATTPTRSAADIFSANRRDIIPVLDSLAKSGNVTLSETELKAVHSIARAEMSAQMSTAAAVLMLLSHYEYLMVA